jgi:hypothetical protein
VVVLDGEGYVEAGGLGDPVERGEGGHVRLACGGGLVGGDTFELDVDLLQADAFEGRGRRGDGDLAELARGDLGEEGEAVDGNVRFGLEPGDLLLELGGEAVLGLVADDDVGDHRPSGE